MCVCSQRLVSICTVKGAREQRDKVRVTGGGDGDEDAGRMRMQCHVIAVLRFEGAHEQSQRREGPQRMTGGKQSFCIRSLGQQSKNSIDVFAPLKICLKLEAFRCLW